MIELLPLGLFEGELFNNVNAFLLLMIILSGILGATSGYASIGAYGAFIVFVRIGMDTDLWIFNSLLYVIATVVMLLLGLQAWGYISSSPGGGEAPA